MEAQLKTHPLVENICVYGDSFQNHTVAIMVPIQQVGSQTIPCENKRNYTDKCKIQYLKNTNKTWL